MSADILATADRRETRVVYDAEAMQPDGSWRWIALGCPRWMAEQKAEFYIGLVEDAVPVHRRVVEVTTTSYVWGDYDRVEAVETREVVRTYVYTEKGKP